MTATATAVGMTDRQPSLPPPGELRAVLRDGTEIFYRMWEPDGPARGALVLFHRGHEHSARYDEFARSLVASGFRIFAWDQRGHGRSPGVRGHAPSFAALIKDADTFVRWIGDRHGVAMEDLGVVGHSVGAVIAAAWVHDYAPPVRAMALVTPAFRIKLYVPLAIPGLRLLNRFRPGASIKSYVRSAMLTHDRDQAAAYDSDSLISRNIAVNVLLGLHDTATRLLADAAAIRTPTLIVSAGSDWVVRAGPQREFFERLSSPVKEMATYRGFHHAVLHESGRGRVFERISQFFVESFQRPPKQTGAASVERNPGAAAAPGLAMRAAYAGAAAFLCSAGRLSAGVRLGWASGFDSGRSLDHVYRNRPEGFTPVGRLIDRVYLASPGWRGIRTRKHNLEAALESAVRQVHSEGRPVNILDVAAGPGRYVMDTMRRLREIPITAVLRDRDERGLAAGRALAVSLGLERVSHESGDAFNPASLLFVRPRPTVAIVSGLYELFEDNALVLQSLRGLNTALEEGGLLIYTNQPWHPQLAFIANVLTNRDGRPWVMRCRSQAEMDGLVAAAGFEKVSMETDEQAIFTVSVARKRRPA